MQIGMQITSALKYNSSKDDETSDPSTYNMNFLRTSKQVNSYLK